MSLLSAGDYISNIQHAKRKRHNSEAGTAATRDEKRTHTKRKIGPAQVRKKYKGQRDKAGFELATFRLRKGIQQEIASSERGCRRATYIAYRGKLDTTHMKKDVISETSEGQWRGEN